MTSKKFGIALLSLLVLALFAVAPVSAWAAATNISAGDTVFIGEGGLDITNATSQNGAGPVVTTLYWFESTTAQPASLTLSAAQKTSFTVSEAVFGSKLGNWYDNASIYGNVTFVVDYPYLSNVQILDNSTSQAAAQDISGKSAIKGDTLQIAFQTNLHTLISQRGLATSSIAAKVVTPDGATLSGLYNASGYTTFINDVLPDNSKYYVQNATGGAGLPIDIWYTGNSAYTAGTYQVWIESNINGMKDNLGAISGKTISPVSEVTIDKETVTITGDKETVVRNNDFAVTVTGKPKTEYYLWITGIGNYNNATGTQIDYAPWITPNQVNVGAAIPAELAYVYKGTATRIRSDVPVQNPPKVWAGNVTTDASGSITVSLSTDGNTKAATYTFRVQKPDGINQLYDTIKVKVEKGAVTVTASGDGSYYLGEEVTLSGTNTDTDDTYMFITGPNLPTNGGVITDAQTAFNESTLASNVDFTKATVKTDDTWEYKWDTAGASLDAGTYTIYAVSKQLNKANLANAKYDTVSVVIKKPFVTATTSASTVAKGDKLYIRGTAEGNPTPGVAIWILGKNYWNGAGATIALSSVTTETVADDGSFEYEVGTATTKAMASGQYFVVVQHPMYNDVFDVTAAYNAVNDQIIVSETATATTNTNFVIWGASKLQGSDAAEALVTSINSPDIDDTYTKLTFLIEEPWIRINSIGDHYVGDMFKVSGTTNLAVGDDLIVEVTSSSFQPTQKTQSSEFSGVSNTVKVTEGDSYNEWAMDVDASTFKPDEYIVNVEAIEADATATTTFNVLKGAAPTTGPVTPTTGPTTVPTTGPTTVPTPEPTASPGFGAFVALIGLGAVAALVMRKD